MISYLLWGFIYTYMVIYVYIFLSHEHIICMYERASLGNDRVGTQLIFVE